MNLKIESVEVIPIRVPLPHVFKGSHYQMKNRCTVLTRVRTADGTVGQIYNADEDEAQLEIVKIIRSELVPLVLGMDAMRTEAIWDAMSIILKDQLRDRWRAMQAIACIDSAVWDVVGKATGVSLHRLWGGSRDRVPMIGIGGYYSDDPESIQEEVGFFADTGMVGMKFKIGKMHPSEDALRLRRAVEAAPAGFMFAVDANQAWSVQEATEFIDLTRDVTPLLWFEEPCLWPGDHQRMRDVRLKTGVPTSAGQMEFTPQGMLAMMRAEAIDFCNYDASWGGGPTVWRRVAAVAALHDVRMGHHEEAQLASHLLASVPHGTYVEAFHPDRDPIYWQMIANRPDLVDGNLVLTGQPGFGWELDASFIDRYRADR